LGDSFRKSIPMEGVEKVPDDLSLATDGFSQGEAGMKIAGSTGGYGWTGPWRDDTLPNYGGDISFFDSELVSTGGGSRAVWRHVAPPLRNSRTVYFSGIFQMEGTDPVVSLFLVLFKFHAGMANSGELNLATIGISDGNFCSRPSPWAHVPTEAKAAGDFGKYVMGDQHLIVGKLEFDVNENGDERLSVWVDPSAGDESKPDKVVLRDTGQTEFDSVAVRYWELDAGTVARVDDVRISKTWKDAVH